MAQTGPLGAPRGPLGGLPPRFIIDQLTSGLLDLEQLARDGDMITDGNGNRRRNGSCGRSSCARSHHPASLFCYFWSCQNQMCTRKLPMCSLTVQRLQGRVLRAYAMHMCGTQERMSHVNPQRQLLVRSQCSLGCSCVTAAYAAARMQVWHRHWQAFKLRMHGGTMHARS